MVHFCCVLGQFLCMGFIHSGTSCLPVLAISCYHIQLGEVSEQVVDYGHFPVLEGIGVKMLPHTLSPHHLCCPRNIPSPEATSPTHC